MWGLTKFIVILSATIGFINGLGMFDHNYFESQESAATTYTVGDLSDHMQSSGEPTVKDYWDITYTWILSGVFVALHICAAVLFLLPYLWLTLGIPWPLIPLLQPLIYMEYYAGIYEMKTGRNLDW